MMLALGFGVWASGMLHLITHAFFKGVLFMCSGSVIHAVHSNDMRKMGGLFNKMPVTAITMLIGCLAIAGVSVPFVIGFSGYYSKDAILEQALSFWQANGGTSAPGAGLFFIVAVFGAALTTCYMFRMWFMTFVGQPRDSHAYEHAHESPPVMTLPLVVLAVLAVSVAWNVQLVGYFVIATAFFIVRGVQQGWFAKLSPAHAHEETDAEHASPAHYHSKDHADTGHVFPAQPHAEAAHVLHAHPHEHSAAAPPFTWAWVGTMLACSLIGGAMVQVFIQQRHPDALMGLTLSGLLEQARPAG